MMMAVFERLQEIGTLKELGFTDREIFYNFTLEGAIIGTVGGVLGAVIGYIILQYLHSTGINFQEMTKSLNFPIEYIIKPSVDISVILVTVIIAIVISSFSAMLPAHYARKLMPAEALKKI
jgi:ABC-type lipoprotein release transport system permease subunit